LLSNSDQKYNQAYAEYYTTQKYVYPNQKKSWCQISGKESYNKTVRQQYYNKTESKWLWGNVSKPAWKNTFVRLQECTSATVKPQSCCKNPGRDARYEGDGMQGMLDSMPFKDDKAMDPQKMHMEMTNFLKPNFDWGTMTMDANEGTEKDTKSTGMLPTISTRSVGDQNFVDVQLMDGDKETMKVALTAKTNTNGGKDFTGVLTVENKNVVKYSAATGDKGGMVSLSGVIENWNSDDEETCVDNPGMNCPAMTARCNQGYGPYCKLSCKLCTQEKRVPHWEHITTASYSAVSSLFHPLNADNLKVVGKNGFKLLSTTKEGKGKKVVETMSLALKDSSAAGQDEFALSADLKVEEEEAQKFTSMMKRVRTGEDDVFTMSVDHKDFAVSATGNKKLQGKKYDMDLTVQEVDAQKKKKSVISMVGNAELKIGASDRKYDMKLQMKDSDDKDIVAVTGEWAETATKGNAKLVLMEPGAGTKPFLQVTSTMPKANDRFKGPLVLTSKSEDLSQKDLDKVQATIDVANGFLPIPGKKFGHADWKKWDVILTTKIDNIEIDSSFYCEQPPEKFVDALPWTGLGMSAKVSEVENAKKKRKAEVSMDFDLAIATPAPGAGAPVLVKIIEKTFTAAIEITDATKFSDADYIASLAKSSGISADQVEVVSKTFEVEVGFTFTGAVVTPEAAKTAIATAWKVSPTDVTIKLDTTRRLRDGEELKRRLADTKVTATLKTADPAVANTVKKEAVDATKVTAELKKANIVITTKATAPAVKVQVVTKLKSKPGATVAVATPDATKIAEVAKAAGGTGASIDAATVSEATVQRPKAPTDLSASGTVGTAFACGIAPSLLTIAMTLASIVQ